MCGVELSQAARVIGNGEVGRRGRTVALLHSLLLLVLSLLDMRSGVVGFGHKVQHSDTAGFGHALQVGHQGEDGVHFESVIDPVGILITGRGHGFPHSSEDCRQRCTWCNSPSLTHRSRLLLTVRGSDLTLDSRTTSHHQCDTSSSGSSRL